MDTHEWSKIITAFFACAYRPALLGLPTEIFAFHFPFYKVLLIGGSAGFFGATVSAFLSKELIIFYEFIMGKLFPKRKKKRFTRTNRFLIKAKKYVSITTIAAVSPVLLSIPFGTFLAVRFFGIKERNKIILVMTTSTVLWTIFLYFVYNKFNNHILQYFK